MVELHWEILDPETLQRIPDGQDFESPVGATVFENLESTTSLNVLPKADAVPEFTETFIIRLYNVTGESIGCFID